MDQLGCGKITGMPVAQCLRGLKIGPYRRLRAAIQETTLLRHPRAPPAQTGQNVNTSDRKHG